MSKKFLFLISFVSVLILAGSASAQIDPNNWLACWWSNGSADSNLWSDANNWYAAEMYYDEANDVDAVYEREPNQVPGPNDIVHIGLGNDWTDYPDDLNDIGPIGNCRLNSDAECYQLWIGADPNDPNQPSHLEMTGGSLTIRVTSDDWVGIGIGWVGTGSMTIHDGIVDINYLAAPMEPQEGGNLNIGGYETGVGTLTMLGGEVYCYHLDCTDWDTSEGHLNLYGGTLYTTADEDWTEFWMGWYDESPNSRCDITEGKAVITSHNEDELYWINVWIDEGKITVYGGDPNYRAEIYADYDITNPGKTTLQAIATLPEQAWNPRPRPGSILDYRPTLTWTPGDYADSHVVYFSSDRDAVINGTAPNTPTGANSVATGILDWTTSYYWRVDEVNDPCLWPGVVWDVRTADHLDVDDMESYGPNLAIRSIWLDYWDDITSGNDALVSVEGTDPVHGGGQSMELAYRCFRKAQNKWMGSWVEASTADLEIGSDWVTGGVKALVLHFYGSTGNGLDHDYPLTQDQMYVELEDGLGHSIVMKYPYDMNDIKIEEWQEFNVDLQDPCLADVDMNDVAKIYIGFGGQEKTGQSEAGAGDVSGDWDTVWFDDIGLYPPRCVPREGLATDITDDCITDYQDISILSRDWLDSDALVSPSAPDPCALAWYQFEEGEGPTVENLGSLGSAADGTLGTHPEPDLNDPTWVTNDPCAAHERCMEFDGINDYVGISDFNSIIEGGITTNTATITAWIKRDGSQSWWTGLVFCTRDYNEDWADSVSIFGLSLGDEADWVEPPTSSLNHVAYHWDSRPDGEEVGWMFRSGLLVPDGVWTFCAVVVEPTQGTVYMSDGTTLYSAVNYDTHLKTTLSEPFEIGRDSRGQWGFYPEETDLRAFKGRIDDVRIYDYSLSRGQISWLAGVTTPVYFPLPSPANLSPKVGPYGWDPNNLDIVDFKDYAVIANDWLEGPILWPRP
jgi:hypothetical protein